MKRTELKRKDIIEAAVEEFSTHGFEGARTAQIAKSAAVSTRTLFKHFPSKEALFDHMVDIVIDQTGAISSAPYDPSLPVRDQLIAALRDYISAITDEAYMRLNRMVMSEYLRDQALAHRIFAHAEMNTNPVRGIIEAAIAANVLDDVDPQYATDLLSGPAIRLFFWPQFLVGAEVSQDTQTVYEDSVDMFLARFGNKAT
ncbi:MAG: TetR/AcrR family transcriptional regulator [Pseudomonadota bacterium]